jgi:Dolichyl-phosphate-mannose-protein mannosyltransferase
MDPKLMAKPKDLWFSFIAIALLLLMAILGGTAAWHESITIDEIAHIAAGVSYLQKLDLRLNEEHPPLAKVLSALPIVARGAHADYSHISWVVSQKFFPAYIGQFVFGDLFLNHWNDSISTLRWARLPMLALTLVLGWTLFVYARLLGGNWAAVLCLSVFVTSPTFLTFGPFVHTDIAVTLFSLLALWRFADLWRNPAGRNVLIFALCFAGALLSKFTAGILLFVFLAVLLSLRWDGVSTQPSDSLEAKNWRRTRWRATVRGILYAAIVVYVFYFIFSLHQSTDALSLLGSGRLTEPFRRFLLPAWLYLRGAFFVVLTGSRPTFILGRAYPHGVWFYFPIIFLLKSPLGFLALLILTFGLAITQRRTARTISSPSIIPEDYAIHWRVLWLALFVFTGFCLLSRLNLSIRHFSIPIVLLILQLSALPKRVRLLGPSAAKLTTALVIVLVASCFATAVKSYPFFMPYLNPLSLGHPAYTLVNDSNLDWSQSLPEVNKFILQHHLQHIGIDSYSLSDPATVVPQSSVWDCQRPTAEDQGQWVVVSAGMILDGHNCLWLMQQPHEPLAGGAMYAILLPDAIPQPGVTGGPPLPDAFRNLGGAPVDLRGMFIELNRHPDTLPKLLEEMQARFEAARKAAASKSPSVKPN